MKRAVNQFPLHPNVEVRRTREVSGGSRRYGSRAGGRDLDVMFFSWSKVKKRCSSGSGEIGSKVLRQLSGRLQMEQCWRTDCLGTITETDDR